MARSRAAAEGLRIFNDAAELKRVLAIRRMNLHRRLRIFNDAAELKLLGRWRVVRGVLVSASSTMRPN